MNASPNPAVILSKIVKFISLSVFCAFCVFLSNYYYELRTDAENLVPKFSIIVFIDKTVKDTAGILEAVESLGIVSVEEFVSGEDVYSKAVERNPFLKDISVPGDKDVFQSYLKVLPKDFPTEEHLLSIKKGLLETEGVDEVIFEQEFFAEYVKIKNILEFYSEAFFIFAIVIFVLFVFKSVLFVLENESNAKKFIANLLVYLFAGAFGFAVLWSVCVFIQYPLLVKEEAAFFIIPFTAICGIIFKD
ncbi:MAG: hypothetical protein FWF00_02340 [Endomicrobia bacterium]|nr:hypothetical protein [Endomicrobiia bacterium]MCL2506515.1 hypothetical protein [Endomicrobiia bacterium]